MKRTAGIVVSLAIPRGMFRSRAFLDLAHRFARCTNCGRVTPDGCEPAHSNDSRHGKGKGLKAHDCFVAALCAPCHRWIDNQGGHGPDPSGVYRSHEKGSMWRRAADATWLEMWRRGWLGVQ